MGEPASSIAQVCVPMRQSKWCKSRHFRPIYLFSSVQEGQGEGNNLNQLFEQATGWLSDIFPFPGDFIGTCVDSLKLHFQACNYTGNEVSAFLNYTGNEGEGDYLLFQLELYSLHCPDLQDSPQELAAWISLCEFEHHVLSLIVPLWDILPHHSPTSQVALWNIWSLKHLFRGQIHNFPVLKNAIDLLTVSHLHLF